MEDNISDAMAIHNINNDTAQRLSESSNINPPLSFLYNARTSNNDQTILVEFRQPYGFAERNFS